MDGSTLLENYGQASKTAVGFFWKSGWAFVFGYFVSALIQSFVPRGRLTPYLGAANTKSISLSTLFGAASSSCSFAALATARSLFLKGAHFTAAVAFMFASTNLVIELGILIMIFLGWQFLVAEIIGGLVLIVLSWVLIQATYPAKWVKTARAQVEEQTNEEEGDFDWKQRIKSRTGWRLVGHTFVKEWQMVWEDILIGFCVAGFVAVFVPASAWTFIFLGGGSSQLSPWLVVLENALLAPFVAAATFIGSMGNIPLATVLNANGVLFAGVMGFIYSDLMVPPLIRVNAKYYGWRIALYIAGIMFISIVATALLLHSLFSFFGIIPHSTRRTAEIVHFGLDYTFWFNLVFAAVTLWLVSLHRRYMRLDTKEEMKSDRGTFVPGIKRIVVVLVLAVLLGGLAALVLSPA